MHAKRAGVAQGTRAGRLNSVLHAQQHSASWRSMVEPLSIGWHQNLRSTPQL